MKILVVNGPNLNLLGEREPAVYGSTTLAEVESMMAEAAEASGHDLKFFQSNHEGEIIDRLQEDRKWMDGLIMNPGALTHYSYALRDTIAAINKPMIEVHLTDLDKREEFRRFTVFHGMPNVRRVMGLGYKGYLEALRLITEYAEHG
jgi:3-dehydroquinate dehydratase-2